MVSVSEPPSWWQRYASLGLRSLTETSVGVLTQDVGFIVRCIAPPSETTTWGESRIRTGIVIGAVQSGKTASMLGVSAKLLDRGCKILVVLAGTRIALWRQTYARLLEQLDGSTPETARQRRSARLLIPNPAIAFTGYGSQSASHYVNSEASRFADAASRGLPTIIVIPKVEEHLLAVSRFIETELPKVMGDGPLEMVIIDDEADDGSILDSDADKVIPRRIEMLWTGRGRAALNKNLYTTYVAYTATPQANLLQSWSNPLSPRSFSCALRNPFNGGLTGVPPRSPTFREPLGLKSYYCGGEMFYGLTDGQPRGLCVTQVAAATRTEVRAQSEDFLLRGLRAFLVAGAIGHLAWRRAGGMSLRDAKRGFPASERKRVPPPRGMLIHPAALQEAHLEEAKTLVRLAGGLGRASAALTSEGLCLPVDALREQILADEGNLWSRWCRDFHDTRARLLAGFGESGGDGSELLDWNAIRQELIDELLAEVQLKIINSSPQADERPDYELQRRNGDLLSAPPDILTIFVSGNVMARGLTLEGLTTTVFTRESEAPAADTQMQMQRWFGYRGSYVHLCRVFCFEDQQRLFSSYHEHDTLMRREVLASMDAADAMRGASPTAGGGEAADADQTAPTLILQGSVALATAKVPTTRLPLHPGPTPSIRLVEIDDAELAAKNAESVVSLLERGDWPRLAQANALVRTTTASIAEVADFLDGLCHAEHFPSAGHAHYRRWDALRSAHGISEKLFGPKQRRHPTEPSVEVTGCPYSIAAFLRLWAVAVTRERFDGIFPSDHDDQPWALARPIDAPEFRIAVKSGPPTNPLSTWDALAAYGIRSSTRGFAENSRTGRRVLKTLWGSRGREGSYLGDQRLDYHLPELSDLQAPTGDPLWRRRGHPGLVVIHVIKSPDPGAPRDGVTVGLCLPHGGPEHFAALTTYGG